MKNKIVIILTIVLVILVSIVIVLAINLKKKTTFTKPKFDKLVLNEIPDDLKYQKNILKISEGYAIYIDAMPKIDDEQLIVNFISLEDNNIWIKLRIIKDNEIIGESGLVRPGEYLKTVKINTNLSINQNITYIIMGYEFDTYLSAGVINLNTKVGE